MNRKAYRGLTTDFSTIILRDNDQCRLRAAAARAVRPGAELFRIAWIARQIIRPLARMLNPDKHRPLIWCHKYPCDFALIRADEEPAGFSGLRISRQHHIVAESCIRVRVNRRRRHICLNPEQPTGVHIEAVR